MLTGRKAGVGPARSGPASLLIAPNNVTVNVSNTLHALDKNRDTTLKGGLEWLHD